MPTQLISLPQSNLAHNAAFSSVPTPGAVALPANVTSLACQLTMSAADQQAATNGLTWTIYVAPAGAAPAQPPPAAGWHAVAQEQWAGGFVEDHAGNSVPSPTLFSESVPPAYQGGWVAAAGLNTGATLKVGCTVTANP